MLGGKSNGTGAVPLLRGAHAHYLVDGRISQEGQEEGGEGGAGEKGGEARRSGEASCRIPRIVRSCRSCHDISIVASVRVRVRASEEGRKEGKGRESEGKGGRGT